MNRDSEQIIEKLKNCPLGQELQVLQKYKSSFDEDIISFLYQTAQKNQCQKIYDFAQKLEQKIILWESYNNSVLELYGNGEYKKAIIYAKLSLQIALKIWGGNHLKTATSLNNLGSLYAVNGEWRLQYYCLKRALKIEEKNLDENHLDIAITLNNLGVLSDLRGKYNLSNKYYTRALKIRINNLGLRHLDTADTLDNMGGMYEKMNFYNKAHQMYSLALSIRLEKRGLKHLETATSINNLGGLYVCLGKYSKAEKYYSVSLKICLLCLGLEHPHTATALDNIASLYELQGKLSRSERFHIHALNIRESLFGHDNINTAISLNNIGMLYATQGRYSEAEIVLRKNFNINIKFYGYANSETALCLSNIAGLYQEQERYFEAKSYYKISAKIYCQTLGIDHSDTLTVFSNLAGIYLLEKNYMKAENIYRIILSRRKMSYEIASDFSTIYNNLGTVLEARRKYREAYQSYIKALEYCTQDKELYILRIIITANNFANLYQSINQFSKSEQVHKKVFRVKQKILGLAHPSTITTLDNLAVLYFRQGRYIESSNVMRKELFIENFWFDRIFPFANDLERVRYIDQMRFHVDRFLSVIFCQFLVGEKNKTRQMIIAHALENIVNRKAITLTISAAFNFLLSADRHPHLKSDFLQLRQLQEQRANLYSQPYDADRHTAKQKLLKDIGAQIRELEIKLAQAVPEFKLSKQTCDRQTLAQHLPNNSVLIEFVRFRLYNFEEKSWEAARYIAFIQVSGNSGELPTVEMIDFGDAEELDHEIRAFRRQVTNIKFIETLTSKPGGNQIKVLKFPDIAVLQEKLIKPLEPYLTNRKIILATDGLLNLLPFAALHNFEANQTLHYLNSGRELLRENIHSDRPCSEPLILADPNFDYPNESGSCDGEIPFNREESRICKILGESVAKKLKVKPYLGDQAWSSRLTKVASPRILLIATHGYYEEEQVHIPRRSPFPSLDTFDSLREKLPEDLPMYRSGLAMAGANTMLRNEALPSEIGSGLLYAEDIASLDLWNTELVVLSACQTAMGDIKDGEGVFGLRRAFALAGAKNVIMSLWSVPAKATGLLMDRLFDEVEKQENKKDYAAALKIAQDYVRTITVKELQQSNIGQEILAELRSPYNRLLNGQDNQQPLRHPYFWAAWICQGI